MENPLRNEVKINVAGEDRVMRASFSAIVAIEKALGKSITSIVNDVARGDISFTDAATIVFHGLRGNSDTRLTFEQVGEEMVKQGLSAMSIPVIEFASTALNGVQMGKPEGEKAPQ